jgi:serine protease SohB
MNRIKGRGTASNRAGRYESVRREAVDDGWFPEQDENPARPATTVTDERARSIISRNASPDIPFDQSVNPYRGCEHGCVYCYARPSHAYLNLSPGLDFETRLFAKRNAAERLREALARPGYRPSPINIGANTDPYQPIERRYRITREVLEVLADARHPCTIITKSAMVERDLDLLAAMARDGLVAVLVSVTSLDNRLSARLEPRASAPHRRIEAIRALSEAGVPVGVLVSPVIPMVTDVDLEEILARGARGGREPGELCGAAAAARGGGLVPRVARAAPARARGTRHEPGAADARRPGQRCALRRAHAGRGRVRGPHRAAFSRSRPAGWATSRARRTTCAATCSARRRRKAACSERLRYHSAASGRPVRERIVTQALLEYLLFLAKTVTLVAAITFIAGLFVNVSRRNREAEGLKVTNLNARMRHAADGLRQALLPKAGRKQLAKQRKHEAKAAEGRRRKRLFVLDFRGDIRASATAALREEISAVLAVAEQGDEVLVRLENAGGLVHEHGLAASQLVRVRERGIPLTVAVDKIAASGGYLMACVADRIIAAPFAIIGSIGVLAQVPNFRRLLDERGVTVEQVKAGRYKRTVSMFGEVTDEDRDKLREELEEVHALFQAMVAKYRPALDMERVATGEYWYGSRALELGLVDEIGTSDDWLARLVDTADAWRVEWRGHKRLMEKLAAAMEEGRLGLLGKFR